MRVIICATKKHANQIELNMFLNTDERKILEFMNDFYIKLTKSFKRVVERVHNPFKKNVIEIGARLYHH